MRPMRTNGITTKTTAPSTMLVSLTDVISSMTRPPIMVSMLRSAIEALEPTAVWIRVVSVVMRDSTSPVRVTSKKAGLWARMLL